MIGREQQETASATPGSAMRRQIAGQVHGDWSAAPAPGYGGREAPRRDSGGPDGKNL